MSLKESDHAVCKHSLALHGMWCLNYVSIMQTVLCTHSKHNRALKKRQQRKLSNSKQLSLYNLSRKNKFSFLPLVVWLFCNIWPLLSKFFKLPSLFECWTSLLPPFTFPSVSPILCVSSSDPWSACLFTVLWYTGSSFFGTSLISFVPSTFFEKFSFSEWWSLNFGWTFLIFPLPCLTFLWKGFL